MCRIFYVHASFSDMLFWLFQIFMFMVLPGYSLVQQVHRMFKKLMFSGSELFLLIPYIWLYIWFHLLGYRIHYLTMLFHENSHLLGLMSLLFLFQTLAFIMIGTGSAFIIVFHVGTKEEIKFGKNSQPMNNDLSNGHVGKRYTNTTPISVEESNSTESPSQCQENEWQKGKAEQKVNILKPINIEHKHVENGIKDDFNHKRVCESYSASNSTSIKSVSNNCNGENACNACNACEASSSSPIKRIGVLDWLKEHQFYQV